MPARPVVAGAGTVTMGATPRPISLGRAYETNPQMATAWATDFTVAARGEAGGGAAGAAAAVAIALERRSVSSSAMSTVARAANEGLNLSSKVAVVSGGTQGIGAAVGIRFAQAGASVFVIGRNAELGNAVVEELRRQSAASPFAGNDLPAKQFGFIQADLRCAVAARTVSDPIQPRERYPGRRGAGHRQNGLRRRFPRPDPGSGPPPTTSLIQLVQEDRQTANSHSLPKVTSSTLPYSASRASGCRTSSCRRITSRARSSPSVRQAEDPTR